MANTMELQKGKFYFMKVTKSAFDQDAHNDFVKACREKGVGIVAMLVEKPEHVSIELDDHIINLMKIDWTDFIVKNYKVIEKHASSMAAKKGAVASEMSVLIRNKIKAALADTTRPEKK